MERIGPIEITGFEGPITIASAAAIASRTSGVGAALGDPLDLDRLDLGLGVLGDQELLQAAPALGGLDLGAHRLLAHRQHRAPSTPSARAICACAAVRRPPSAMNSRAVEAGGEVAVGEPEPVGRPELDQAVEDGEGVVLDAPAALLVDLAAEPVGDQVGVGGDVDARDLDVVGGVGDHREPVAEQVLHARRELAPPVPPARTTQRSIPLTATLGLGPVVVLGKAGDPDARRGSCSGR